MRTWISRVAVAVLAVSALAGTVAAGPASADDLVVQTGVGKSVLDDIVVPGLKEGPDPDQFPNEGPKHGVIQT